jgi:hypothetical protein
MPLQFDPDASCQITASMPEEFGHDGEHWASEVACPNLVFGEAGSVCNLLDAVGQFSPSRLVADLGGIFSYGAAPLHNLSTKRTQK